MATSSAAGDAAGVAVEELAPLQQAQVKCAQMRAAIALGSCLHTLQHGSAELATDAFASERTMLEAYDKKVQAAVAKQELGRSKRKHEINIDAAHRFITHAVPDLSAEAKQDLHKVCSAWPGLSSSDQCTKA